VRSSLTTKAQPLSPTTLVLGFCDTGIKVLLEPKSFVDRMPKTIKARVKIQDPGQIWFP